MKILNFVMRSKPNQSPKHMSAFANVVEDRHNFNFAIQSFPCSVQNFGEKSQSKCVDQPVFLFSSRSRAPTSAQASALPPCACALASALGFALRSCGPTTLPDPPSGQDFPCWTPASTCSRAQHTLAPGAPPPDPPTRFRGHECWGPWTSRPAWEPWPRRGCRRAYKNDRCSFPERGPRHHHAPLEATRRAPPHMPPYHLPSSPPLSITTREPLNIPARRWCRFHRRSQAPHDRLPTAPPNPSPVETLSQPSPEIEPRRPQAALRLSLAGHSHRTRRIPASRTGEPPKDHIARFLLFPGLFMESKGLSAIEANSQGRPCN
jgi:hypothetical protein